jgi:hypothetical protein
MNLLLEDLKRWFKEKWTSQDGGECGSYKGRGRVKCRPSKKVSSKTPETWGEMTKKEKKKAVRNKQKAHKKGHQFSTHKSGKTWKAKKGKYRPSLKEQVNYSGPHLEGEWEEAQRYPNFKNQEQWIKTGSTGRVVNFSELGDVLNHDSDVNNLEPEKIKRVKSEIEKGEINYPIIGRMPDGKHELIGGNTRVAVLRSMGHDPKVWVFDMPHKDVKEEWNPKNKKKHSACKAKIKSKVKVWPSAYASGLLVQCYKKKSKKKINESTEKEEIINFMKNSMRNPLRFYYLLLLAGEPATEAQKTLYNLKFPMIRTTSYEIRKKMMKMLTKIIDLMVTDPILYNRLRSLAIGKKLKIDEEMSVGNSAIPAVSSTEDGSIETPPVAAGVISAMPPKKKKRIPQPILALMFRNGDRP